MLISLAVSGCSSSEHVHRQHSDRVPDAFEPLTHHIEFSFPGDVWLGRREAEQDLDELEWLLEHRYAYLTRNSVDYRAALDSIRVSLGDRIRRGTFALQLQKLLSLFGDGHILEERWLYGADWQGWSQAERAAVQLFARGFVPAWPLPPGHFSAWHYFVLSPSTRPEYYHYRQPVVILMDSANFSATDIFLGAFKGRHHVTLMGTPSGGGSGRYQSFRLRHSLIKVRLSSMVSFQPGGDLYDGNGIQPDALVEPAPTDLIGQTDSALDAARRKLQTGPDRE